MCRRCGYSYDQSGFCACFPLGKLINGFVNGALLAYGALIVGLGAMIGLGALADKTGIPFFDVIVGGAINLVIFGVGIGLPLLFIVSLVMAFRDWLRR